MDNTENTPAPGPERIRVNRVVFTNEGQDIPMFYVNNTQVNFSNIDATIDFGLIQGASNDELRVKKTVRIMMSLPHAKAVLGVLANSIEQLERQFGEIKS